MVRNDNVRWLQTYSRHYFNKAIITALLIIISTAAICSRAYALEGEADDTSIIFREEFNSLDSWKPLTFPKIDKHTTYEIEQSSEGSHVKAVSSASASGIVFKKKFDVYSYPRVRWRWKVNNVFEKGNAKEKSGDDYPLRIYIIFKYDPETASFGKKITYGLAKQIYGEYPPHSSLNYIWANRPHNERIIENTYASEAQMIILQTGEERAGEWVEEEIHIVDDYREAFGEEPPSVASIAIMNDSDNTGESAVSYVDYIEVSR